MQFKKCHTQFPKRALKFNESCDIYTGGSVVKSNIVCLCEMEFLKMRAYDVCLIEKRKYIWRLMKWLRFSVDNNSWIDDSLLEM